MSFQKNVRRQNSIVDFILLWLLAWSLTLVTAVDTVCTSIGRSLDEYDNGRSGSDDVMSLSSNICFFFFLLFSFSPSPFSPPSLSKLYRCYGDNLINATGILIKHSMCLFSICYCYYSIISFLFLQIPHYRTLSRHRDPHNKHENKTYCLDPMEWA